MSEHLRTDNVVETGAAHDVIDESHKGGRKAPATVLPRITTADGDGGRAALHISYHELHPRNGIKKRYFHVRDGIVCSSARAGAGVL